MVEINGTQAALLGLLLDGPQAGGQLMTAAETRFGPVFSITRSQVYRELPTLAGAGLVKATASGVRNSQPYTITAAGRKAFTRWFTGTEGAGSLRNSTALRAAFMGHVPAADLADVYGEADLAHTQALADAQALLKVAKADRDIGAAAALELGVQYHKAVLRWLAVRSGFELDSALKTVA